jgi:predicted alpha/beta-hydrolase family hydrolase
MARLTLVVPRAARAVVVLGHGAGGDCTAPVLVAVRDALVAAHVAVALVDQPYRVAGRRTPDRSPKLDAAMCDVVAALPRSLRSVPLHLGGKSSGARVGARIATAVSARGVVALGFPLRPPAQPERSRAAELDTGCAVLVVQGSRDVFGAPDDVRAAARGLPVTVHEIEGGNHSFVALRLSGRSTAECLKEVAAVVTQWVTRPD